MSDLQKVDSVRDAKQMRKADSVRDSESCLCACCRHNSTSGVGDAEKAASVQIAVGLSA